MSLVRVHAAQELQQAVAQQQEAEAAKEAELVQLREQAAQMQQALAEAAAALEEGDAREATGDAKACAVQAQLAALQDRNAQLEQALHAEPQRPNPAGNVDAEGLRQLQLLVAEKDAALAERAAQVAQLQVSVCMRAVCSFR